MSKEENKQTYSTDKENTDLPGYPSYPANEDITEAKNNEGRVILEQENAPIPVPGDEDNSKEDIVMGTDADVNSDDLELLNLIDNNPDTADSLNLLHATLDDVDTDGEPLNENIDSNDLDIPGSELDNSDEVIGEEDEENNYYSLGGDNHEDLEEDKG